MNQRTKRKIGLDHEGLDYEAQLAQVAEASQTKEELKKNTNLTRLGIWIALLGILIQAIVQYVWH